MHKARTRPKQAQVLACSKRRSHPSTTVPLAVTGTETWNAHGDSGVTVMAPPSVALLPAVLWDKKKKKKWQARR